MERENDKLPLNNNGEEIMAARLCPYCKVVSNFTRVSSLTAAQSMNTPPKQRGQILTLDSCANCEAYVYFRGHQDNVELVYDQYPKVVDEAPTELPEPIQKAFSEALKCYGAEAPNGSLLMCRRALQEVMTDKKAKKGDLPTQLQDLVDRQEITPRLKSWAEAAQVGGRIAAHGSGGIAWGDPDKIWGTMEDADAVIKYLQSLFDYLYVLDVRHRARLGIPDDVTEAQSETENNEP